MTNFIFIDDEQAERDRLRRENGANIERRILDLQMGEQTPDAQNEIAELLAQRNALAAELGIVEGQA